MHLSTILSVVVLAFTQAVTAVPTPQDVDAEAEARTSGLLVRKEWRSLSQAQRSSYIKAVKCLASKPARFSSIYPGAITRYDDYQAIHIAMTEQIHFTGTFLPWHRQFVSIFEQDLRKTCGYTGAQPYWDWSLDASIAKWAKSPVFDPVYGFGGNGAYLADISGLLVTSALDLPGRTGGGCVTTGPWANTVVPMGPGNSFAYQPHCLRRDFSPTLASLTMNSSRVAWVQAATSFGDYDHRVQGYTLNVPGYPAAMGPTGTGIATHGGGHFSVGGMVGEMSDMYSSPGDPLFWLHHGNLDRQWNLWQRADWKNRKSAIGGPDTMWAYPYNVFGDIPYKNITLAFPLTFKPLSNSIIVNDVMDITRAPLGAYTYA